MKHIEMYCENGGRLDSHSISGQQKLLKINTWCSVVKYHILQEQWNADSYSMVNFGTYELLFIKQIGLLEALRFILLKR